MAELAEAVLTHTPATSSARSEEAPSALRAELEVFALQRRLRAPIPMIFVIEDDALLRSLLVEWLTAEGYRVSSGDAGAGAPNSDLVAVSISDEARVQLLIVDVFMPRGHGIDRLRSARTAHPGVPLIAISGQFDPGVGAAGAAAAALRVDRVVAKPFERETMLDAVRSLIGKPS
jgi:DNA-binding response OmpR family regulator